MYLRVYLWVSLRVYLRVYHGGYPRGVPKGVPWWVSYGVYLPGMPPYVPGCIPPWYVSLCTQGGVYLPICTLLYHPGYTTHPVHYWSPYYTPGVLHGVHREEALGSRRRITVGMRRIEVSSLPKV